MTQENKTLEIVVNGAYGPEWHQVVGRILKIAGRYCEQFEFTRVGLNIVTIECRKIKPQMIDELGRMKMCHGVDVCLGV